MIAMAMVAGDVDAAAIQGPFTASLIASATVMSEQVGCRVGLFAVIAAMLDLGLPRAAALLPHPTEAKSALDMVCSVLCAVLGLPGHHELDAVLGAVSVDDYIVVLRAAGAAVVQFGGVRGRDAAAQSYCLRRLGQASEVMVGLVDGIKSKEDDADELDAERGERVQLAYSDDSYLEIFATVRRLASRSKPPDHSKHPEHIPPRIWPHLAPHQQAELARRGLRAAISVYSRRIVAGEDIVVESPGRTSPIETILTLQRMAPSRASHSI